MSLRSNNASKACSVTVIYDETSTRCFDKTSLSSSIDLHEDITDFQSSISSEEENGSEYDGEQNVRAKPIMEIWDNKLIANRLQALPQAEEITTLLNSPNPDSEDSSIIFSKNKSSLLLLATWFAHDSLLKKLLEKEAAEYKDVKGLLKTSVDEGGRTALHLAACAGNTECMRVLLQNGAQVSATDSVNKATPLHCAASKGHLSCLKLLIKHGADVNSGIATKSPLYYAVQGLATDCVRELLENKAIPNTSQIFSETPLHVAAVLGASEIITLLLAHGAAVNVQHGPEKMSPLHLSSEDGDAPSTRLLLDAGAFIEAENGKKQTPLHLAALSQCAETMELLLARGANPRAKDKDGRTPLHSAIVKISRSCECVRLLLAAGSDPNQQDSFGYTPLHLAALNEFSNCVMLLINHGGDVTVRTNGGISVLCFITRKTPDVVPKYMAKFDASVKLNDHEIGDVDCELKLDFRALVPTLGNGETELLLNFIEVGHREVLKHPLCETFLFLKWRRIRKFFFFSLCYHILFAILYAFYTIDVYVDFFSVFWMQIVADSLLGLNVLMLSKELFQIFHSWRSYVKQWENWLQWSVIISVFCCVKPTLDATVPKPAKFWQDHVAAVGIFLSWLELMMIVGRFPLFRLHIQMFTTVSVNFVKYVAAYICLLIAFALSFGVLFSNYKSFKDLKWIIIKVLVMMSGELEYEDIFYDEDSPIQYNWTAQIMFLGYVILVAVILTNLMVGLAVNDIQGLQQSAGLDKLVRQAELVAHLESMLFSRLLKCIPHKIMQFFHRKALLLKSQYHWALCIKPNDPREERIPKELIKSIYNLVVERKEKPKFIKNKSGCFSPALSRMNSGSSSNCNQLALKRELEELSAEFEEYTKIFTQKLQLISGRLLVARNVKNS